jgi:hypothetical protein
MTPEEQKRLSNIEDRLIATKNIEGNGSLGYYDARFLYQLARKQADLLTAFRRANDNLKEGYDTHV